MPLTASSLIKRVTDALLVDDAQHGLGQALSVLAGAGISETAGELPAWLEVKRAGRALSLAAPTPPDEPALREAVAGLLGLALERVREQEGHRRACERMEMLSAASFEGVLIHVDGVVVDTNQSLSELLGYAPSELLGPDTMRRCVAPEDLPGVLQKLRDRYEGTYVITGVRKDGSRFRAELQSKQGKLGERPVRVAAVRDVTEREHTLALLAESETRLRDLAEKVFDFLVISADSVALEVGGGVERVLGYRGSEMVGRDLVDFVASGSKELTARVLAEQRTGAYQIELLSRSGEQIPAEVFAVMSTRHGRAVRVAGVRDLRPAKQLERERQALEAELVRNQRLESLGVLAGGVAHDFNNLLVGMLGNAEFLQERLTRADERESCEAIVGAARRAADLTAQLLAYAGQRELGPKQPVDLGLLWRDLRTLLGARLSHDAELVLDVTAGGLVVGDRAALTQVLMNLLANASEALGGAPGRIEVRTLRVTEPDERWKKSLGAAPLPGDWVQVEVRDTGAGMTRETLERLFEPFFTTKEKGHGLGLPSCLGIVTAHGGAITVESELGSGTCVSLLLPAAKAKSPPLTRAAIRATGLGRKILVIDDEPIVRAMLRRTLERRGYAVVEAVDGRTGLRAIREEKPDLIMLDMTMPDLDGTEVMRLVRAEGNQTPIVIASGHLDVTMGQRLVKGSFQGFLSKPFNVAELIAAIEGALAGAGGSNRPAD